MCQFQKLYASIRVIPLDFVFACSIEKNLDPKQFGLHDHIGMQLCSKPISGIRAQDVFLVEFDVYMNSPKEKGTDSSICSSNSTSLVLELDELALLEQCSAQNSTSWPYSTSALPGLDELACQIPEILIFRSDFDQDNYQNSFYYLNLNFLNGNLISLSK